jgi:hypothetical protein
VTPAVQHRYTEIWLKLYKDDMLSSPGEKKIHGGKERGDFLGEGHRGIAQPSGNCLYTFSDPLGESPGTNYTLLARVDEFRFQLCVTNRIKLPGPGNL